MRVGFLFATRLVDALSGCEVTSPDFGDVFRLDGDSLDVYLDACIADYGIVGGEFNLIREGSLVSLAVYYWSPGIPSRGILESLQNYTVAQLEDGAGEGGFDCEVEGRRLIVLTNTSLAPAVEIKEDGRIVLGPPKIAMAARDGDLQHLTAAIELEKSGIERLHQGYTALHLAILYGHVSAVQLLLAAGANPNSVAADGTTSLQACALSNSLDDEESCYVAQALLNASCNSIRNTPQSDLAQSYAKSRGKKMLAAIL